MYSNAKYSRWPLDSVIWTMPWNRPIPCSTCTTKSPVLRSARNVRSVLVAPLRRRRAVFRPKSSLSVINTSFESGCRQPSARVAFKTEIVFGSGASRISSVRELSTPCSASSRCSRSPWWLTITIRLFASWRCRRSSAMCCKRPP